MIIAFELGLLYAVMAVGVYLTYRVLDFPDLTVDGSFTTGAAVVGTMIISGVPAWLATVCALGAGMVAGMITGGLHTWAKINPLLSGILTQIALYSINLRIMGKSNISLLRTTTTLLSPLFDAGWRSTWVSVGVFLTLAAVIGIIVYWFLGTNYGVAMRAVGDNQEMAAAQGINVNRSKIVGLAISNGLVALCGAVVAQYQGFADISMGIGLVVAGLASVIVGQAIFGMTAVWQAVLAAVLGSVIYRSVIQLALGAGLNPNDMKLVSAVLVVIALVAPRWAPLRMFRKKRRMALEQRAQEGTVA